MLPLLVLLLFFSTVVEGNQHPLKMYDSHNTEYLNSTHSNWIIGFDRAYLAGIKSTMYFWKTEDIQEIVIQVSVLMDKSKRTFYPTTTDLKYPFAPITLDHGCFPRPDKLYALEAYAGIGDDILEIGIVSKLCHYACMYFVSNALAVSSLTIIGDIELEPSENVTIADETQYFDERGVIKKINVCPYHLAHSVVKNAAVYSEVYYNYEGEWAALFVMLVVMYIFLAGGFTITFVMLKARTVSPRNNYTYFVNNNNGGDTSNCCSGDDDGGDEEEEDDTYELSTSSAVATIGSSSTTNLCSSSSSSR